MHQRVVEYEATPEAMMGVPEIPRQGEAANLRSYVTAACIAAGLVAAWLGLLIV